MPEPVKTFHMSLYHCIGKTDNLPPFWEQKFPPKSPDCLQLKSRMKGGLNYRLRSGVNHYTVWFWTTYTIVLEIKRIFKMLFWEISWLNLANGRLDSWFCIIVWFPFQNLSTKFRAKFQKNLKHPSICFKMGKEVNFSSF